MEHYGTIQGLPGSSLQILLLHHWSHWGTSKAGHRRLSPEPANSDMSAFEVLVTQSESWALDFLFALWSAQLSVATRKMISTRRWGELDISTEHQESPYSARWVLGWIFTSSKPVESNVDREHVLPSKLRMLCWTVLSFNIIYEWIHIYHIFIYRYIYMCIYICIEILGPAKTMQIQKASRTTISIQIAKKKTF